MSLWTWLLIACAAAYLTKLAGYLVPARLLKNKRITRVAGTLTIGLLASLTIVNTVASGTALAIDSRLGALAAAAVALVLKAPFLVVVIVGAATAALLRMAGLP
jgi:uncharacterized membrane protein